MTIDTSKITKWSNNAREEEIKNKVAYYIFNEYDCTNILDNIDFSVTSSPAQGNIFIKQESHNTEYFLWAEAKRPSQKDIHKLFVQLILTIGKSEKLRSHIPPLFLGAFNSEKIAFIPFSKIEHILHQNDFNWNITPSSYDTREFKQLYDLTKNTLEKNSLIFKFVEDEEDLKKFIKKNFCKNSKNVFTPIEVTKNNFTHIYRRWLDEVKNSIDINWETAKKNNILDVDFFFADLFSKSNITIKDNLNAVLKTNHYEYARQETELGISSLTLNFKDNGQAHADFWIKYKRPPMAKYQDYILKKRGLLVPQDIRERKGAYFTPQIWVQKSQEYLANYLGENWQDEYYIWDCCAGTGNMESGLIDKYRIWASTLDKSDVDIMKESIKDGANLLESHIFQFDFLNDNFEDKCPKDLLEILQDENKRKKLIIYINPPIKEPTSSKTIVNKNSKHINKIAESKIKQKYQHLLNQGAKELSTQFLTRIYYEIPNAFIASFCTLKYLLGTNSKEFRQIFKAKLEKMFIVPANTFDNVKGKFPYGFFIWNTQIKNEFKMAISDIYNKNGDFIGTKNIIATPELNIKDWLREYKDNDNPIGWLVRGSADVQNNGIVFITSKPSQSVLKASNASLITKNNLIANVVFLAVRRCIQDTWINDRDQYLYPNDKWKDDKEFQSNCLAYALFNNNEIKSSIGKNHWIPYMEHEVNPKSSFESHFMTDFIKEKKIEFSEIAKEVLLSGVKLYKYYHLKDDSNPNASFYDIKLYFQGHNNKGIMNSKSEDEAYNLLLWNLNLSIKKLVNEIIPKIYEYGFLTN